MEQFTPFIPQTFTSIANLSSIETGDIFKGFEETKVNESIFEDDCNDADGEQRLRSYLRIRPVNDYDSSSTDSTFHVLDSRKLIACPPSTSAKHKVGSRKRQEFEFNRIFNEHTTTEHLYESCVQPLIEQYLQQQENVLLFAYGTTGAGKSHTIRGGDEQLGLVPASIAHVFRRIQSHVLSKPLVRRTKFDEQHVLSIAEQALELNTRECILREVKDSAITDLISATGAHTAQYSHLPSLAQRLPYANMRCVPWISYLELYNETIIDLLAKNPSPMRVMRDGNGNFFVHGVRQVFVENLNDSLKVLQFGLENLKKHVSRTGMNAVSSRSHAIFTISLVWLLDCDEIERNLEFDNEFDSQPLVHSVCSLSLADLAGLERAKKTGNAGARLKEAGAINKSLFTLNRCVCTLRANANNDGPPARVPYQESLLTKLFQPYLCGFGITAMVIAINPMPEHYDETIVSLEFSAIASKVVLPKEQVRKAIVHKVKRLTQLWMQSSQNWSTIAREAGPLLSSGPSEYSELCVEAPEIEGMDEEEDLVLNDTELDCLNSLLERVEKEDEEGEEEFEDEEKVEEYEDEEKEDEYEDEEKVDEYEDEEREDEYDEKEEEDHINENSLEHGNTQIDEEEYESVVNEVSGETDSTEKDDQFSIKADSFHEKSKCSSFLLRLTPSTCVRSGRGRWQTPAAVRTPYVHNTSLIEEQLSIYNIPNESVMLIEPSEREVSFKHARTSSVHKKSNISPNTSSSFPSMPENTMNVLGRLLQQLQNTHIQLEKEIKDQKLNFQVQLSDRLLALNTQLTEQYKQQLEEQRENQERKLQQQLQLQAEEYEYKIAKLNEELECAKDEHFAEQEMWQTKKTQYQVMIKDCRKSILNLQVERVMNELMFRTCSLLEEEANVATQTSDKAVNTCSTHKKPRLANMATSPLAQVESKQYLRKIRHLQAQLALKEECLEKLQNKLREKETIIKDVPKEQEESGYATASKSRLKRPLQENVSADVLLKQYMKAITSSSKNDEEMRTAIQSRQNAQLKTDSDEIKVNKVIPSTRKKLLKVEHDSFILNAEDSIIPPKETRPMRSRKKLDYKDYF